MKFGQTLFQRSIPEWAIHNVDYSDLKHLIKIRTTPTKGRSRPIDIDSTSPNEAFEREFHNELLRQHDRVNEFVQVKRGEIKRRIVALDAQVSKLKNECLSSERLGRHSRRTVRFAKLDAELSRASDDIQSLSRFSNANTLAFEKVLKKFRKWTGSRALDDSFRALVLHGPDGLSKCNLDALQATYSKTASILRLNYDRQPAIRRHTSKTSVSINDAENHCARTLLSSSLESRMDFDIAMATTRFGKYGSQACYWIHLDDLEDVQSLLLQHTTIWFSNKNDRIEAADINVQSIPPQNDVSVDEQVSVRTLCDDITNFSKSFNCLTADCADRPWKHFIMNTWLTIRHSEMDNMFITLRRFFKLDLGEFNEQDEDAEGFQTAAVSRHTTNRALQGQDCSEFFVSDETRTVLSFMKRHKECRQLATIASHRQYYLGHGNSEEGGVWATMDWAVEISKPESSHCRSYNNIIGGAKDMPLSAETKSFPYAVLEVREEGTLACELISFLDSSHLLKRIRGFSLEAHAISVIHNPIEMSRPYWLSMLAEDFRLTSKDTGGNLASSRCRVQRGSSVTQAGTSDATMNTLNVSRPATNTIRMDSVEPSSSIDGAPLSRKKHKKEKKRQNLARQKRLDDAAAESAPQRYWNEFDDGSDGEHYDSFAIYVDPNAPTFTFPGATIFTAWADTIAARVSKLFAATMKNLRQENLEGGFRHLPGASHSSPDESDFSEDDEEFLIQRPRQSNDNCPTDLVGRSQYQYSTFAASSLVSGKVVGNHTKDGARENFHLRASLLSFIASTVILVIVSLLVTTGRKKQSLKVEAGAILGVTMAIMFAFVGGFGVLSLSRSRANGWVYRTVVLLAVTAILGGSSLLLIAMKRR